MYCSQCGAQLQQGAKFCTVCGKPISAVPCAGTPSGTPVCGAAPLYAIPVYLTSPETPEPAAPAEPIYRRAPESVQSRTNAPDIGDVLSAPDLNFEEPIKESCAETAAETAHPAEALSVWQTILCYLALFCLPIGNVIFACIWGFRLNEHPQRRAMARAALPFIAIGLLATFAVLLFITLNMNSISITIR